MKVVGSEQVEALCLRGELLTNLPRGGGYDALLIVEVLPRVLLLLLALDKALPRVPLGVLLFLSIYSGAVSYCGQSFELFLFFCRSLQADLSLAQGVKVDATEGTRAELRAARVCLRPSNGGLVTKHIDLVREHRASHIFSLISRIQERLAGKIWHVHGLASNRLLRDNG